MDLRDIIMKQTPSKTSQQVFYLTALDSGDILKIPCQFSINIKKQLSHNSLINY